MSPEKFQEWHKHLLDPVKGPLARKRFVESSACCDLIASLAAYVSSAFPVLRDDADACEAAANEAVLDYLRDPHDVERFSYRDGAYGFLRTVAWRKANSLHQSEKRYQLRIQSVAENGSPERGQVEDPSTVIAEREWKQRVFDRVSALLPRESDRRAMARAVFLEERLPEAVAAIHPSATAKELKRIVNRITVYLKRHLGDSLWERSQ